MRANRNIALAFIATLPVAFVADVSAHRRDELLQAARIGVEPDRVHVELDLTPGIAVADALIRQIDGDGDGVLSPAEQREYAEGVQSGVKLRVDDLPPLALVLADARFPSVTTMRGGEAAIKLVWEAGLPLLDTGSHHLFFRNDNPTDNSVYLANALVPDSDQVAVTGQQRDFKQSELTVEFTLRETRFSGHRWIWIALACPLALATLLTGGTELRRRWRERGERLRSAARRVIYDWLLIGSVPRASR